MKSRVETGVLLGVGDIAALAGVKPNVVSNWRKRSLQTPVAKSTARRSPFPEPHPVFSTRGRPVFRVEQVRDWLESNGKVVGEPAGDVLLWSAYLQSLRDASTTDAMLAVLALASARRMCDVTGEHGWEAVVAAADVSWDRYQQIVAKLGPPELTSLPTAVVDRGPAQTIAPLLDAIGRVPVVELPDMVDAFLTRLDDSLGRKESDFGSIGSPIATLLGRMAAHTQPQELLDPVAGMGGALTDALRAGANPDKILAADIDTDALLVAQRRLFLRGESVEVLHAALPDGEGSKKLADLRCGAVIAEPPFSNEFRLFGFLHFVAAHLSDSGAGFVVTRASVLDSRSDEVDRRDVLHANILSAVVALPSKLLRHSPMPLALWVLQSPNTLANKGDRRVHLVDASDSSQEELADVVASRLLHEDDNSESVWVSPRELDESGVNLNPTAWLAQQPDFDAALSTLETAGEALARDSVVLESLDTGVRPTSVTSLGELAAAGVIQFPHGRPTDHQAGDVMVEIGAAITTWISDGKDAGRGRWPVWVRVLRAEELHPEYLVIALRSNRAKPVLDMRHHVDLIPGLSVPWMPIGEQRAFVAAHSVAESLAARAQALADAMITSLAVPG